MREGLQHGRQRGYHGWDNNFENVTWHKTPIGTQGVLFEKLQEEVLELALAIHDKNKSEIRKEAADVANLAMMVADIHSVLN